MIIKSVKARRYRCFSDFSTELGPGLVVIRGPNESGKSTLQSVLIDAFFTMTSSKAQEIRDNTTWRLEDLPELELELDLDGSNASLYKDFQEKKERMELGETVLSSPKAVFNKITEKLGCPSKDFYLATACISEESVEIPRLDLKLVCHRVMVERLQAMLTGAPGGSPGEVMERLKKRYNAIKKAATPKSPEAGPAAALSADLKQVRERLHKLRQQKNEWDLAAAEYEKLGSREAALSEELAGLKAAVANHRLYLQVREEVERLGRELERAIKAAELSRELARVEERLASFKGYQELVPEIKRLGELREEQDRADHLLTELSFEKYKKKAPAPAAAWALLVIAALAAAGGGAAAFMGETWPALAGAGAALLFGAAAWRVFSSAAGKTRSQEAEIESGIRKCEQQIETIREEMAAIIKRFGRVSVEDCLEAWQEYLSVQRNSQALATRISDLAGEEADRKELERRAKGLSLNLHAAKERLSTLEPYRVRDHAEFARMERDSAKKDGELAELRNKKSRAMARMENARFDPGQLISLEEEEAELAERLAHWERQLRVHEKALEVLQEAAGAVIKKAGQVIEKQIGPIISEVTGGRYEKVRADNDLCLSVLHPAAGDWVGTDVLSLATREQLHFAARLALVKLITNGKNPPLLLDDPFSHYDSERLERAMKVAREYAATNQVIVFSATDRYDRWADKVICLEPASTGCHPPD